MIILPDFISAIPTVKTSFFKSVASSWRDTCQNLGMPNCLEFNDLMRKWGQHYSSGLLPVWLMMADQLLIRGYTKEDGINCDRAVIVTGDELQSTCEQILGRDDVAYVHVRSKFNCFLCLVESVE